MPQPLNRQHVALGEQPPRSWPCCSARASAPVHGGRHRDGQFAASSGPGHEAVPLDNCISSSLPSANGGTWTLGLHPFNQQALPGLRGLSFRYDFLHSFMHSLTHSTDVYEVSAACLTCSEHREQSREQDGKIPPYRIRTS